jgi:catechol 2,3-dioxygenase-like lactoylglutathione lyase family enzyme
MAIDLRGACPMFQVFDMPTSLAFYCDVLGFQIVQSAGPAPRCGWALLRRDGIELMLNTQFEDDDRPANGDPVRKQHHGDASIFFDCSDPDAAYSHFRVHGVDAQPPVVRDYGWKQVYITDPDGYVLCFHRPATPQEKGQSG